MSAGSIWWSQIGNSLRLLKTITDHLRDCQSAVLQVPQTMPWRQDFYDAVDFRRSFFSGERRLKRLQWEEKVDPGEFVLEELCSDTVRADYWPGQSYGEYLGSRDDIVLNEYYVWITDVHKKSDLVKWTEFLTQYHRAAKKLESSAVFIIEYDGPSAEVSGVDKIMYTVENYDCRVFCLETAAASNNTDMHIYQAELALCIGGNDPDLCRALIEKGNKLLYDPVRTATATRRELGLAERTEQSITSAAWKAAIVLLFPILEQYRMDFVTKHKTELERHLPITNSNGDRVNDPFDLEVGNLYYVVTACSREFQPEEMETLKLCRNVRNLLAHNKVVPYEDVRQVIRLG